MRKIIKVTSKYVVVETEDDKVYHEMIHKDDLIEYIIENRLNIMEVVNYDCTDIDEEVLDAATYLHDNMDEVVVKYLEETV